MDCDDQVVEIYTDGACSGNPGPGGWGVLLRYGRREIELYGSEADITTSNRMELTAPIRALESLARPSVVRIFTDSKPLVYVSLLDAQQVVTRELGRGQITGSFPTLRQPDASVLVPKS